MFPRDHCVRTGPNNICTCQDDICYPRDAIRAQNPFGVSLRKVYEALWVSFEVSKSKRQWVVTGLATSGIYYKENIGIRLIIESKKVNHCNVTK